MIFEYLQGRKYKIVRFIGSGGFGCTYEATHVMLGKRLAIKEFFVKDLCNRDSATGHISVGVTGKSALVNRLKEKFIEEAVALSEMSHPNIVKVIDVFEENGTAYYVMEYIDGPSLDDIVKAGGPLSENKAISYIGQVADALSYVHSLNRLHLDVKPGNIMVNPNGKAILIDFGVSKQYDEVDGENTSTLLGKTPGYAPLEQMGNNVHTFTPATDIYALGATLYKLLSGNTPPQSTYIINDGLPPLQSHISENVRNAIYKSMELRWKNRPQSISEFLTLLEKTECGKSSTDQDSEREKTEISVTVGSDETQYGDKPIKLKAHLSSHATFKQRQEIEKLLNNMVYVAGGTFLMGAQRTDPNAPNYDREADSDESPVHSVTVSSFYMCKYEVTQGLWKAVMGTKSSFFKGNHPVENVSWYDCQDFIAKLNELTGKEFRLPTEAEWEYAARGGNKSRGYKYSGSNTIGDVAWYQGNSSGKTHPVGSKQPNELGLYDMSGNVGEWCQDCYGSYSSYSQTDPTGPSSDSDRVFRGGSCRDVKQGCRVSYRCSFELDDCYSDLGLRLVCQESDKSSTHQETKREEPEKSATVGSNETQYDGDKTTKLKAHLSNNATSTQRQEIEKLLGSMVYVEGGTFLMGAQSVDPSAPNYDSEADDWEGPVHSVTVSSFYMSKYEVTQGLWEAVMGTNPSYIESDNLPVENVSWYDCQDFIAKLNKLTGKEFRLPTEAEWEYAARGGNKSRGYKYSGSNTIGNVAWYDGNSSSKTHPVGSKQPNELGLYDMTGNVWEWCSDWYSSNYYEKSSQTNPTGPSSGSRRVYRGGSWFNLAWGCRVSFRRNGNPAARFNYRGIRLVCR